MLKKIRIHKLVLNIWFYVLHPSHLVKLTNQHTDEIFGIKSTLAGPNGLAF